MKQAAFSAILGIILCMTSACSTTAPTILSVANNQNPVDLENIALASIDVTAYDISHHIRHELDPALAARIKANLTNSALNSSVINMKSLPELPTALSLALHEHKALLETVLASVLSIEQTNISAWKQVGNKFDFHIGPGLRELKQTHQISHLIFINAISFNDNEDAKHSVIVSLIETDTGRLEWLYKIPHSNVFDFREPDGTNGAINQALASLKGAQ